MFKAKQGQLEVQSSIAKNSLTFNNFVCNFIVHFFVICQLIVSFFVSLSFKEKKKCDKLIFSLLCLKVLVTFLLLHFLNFQPNLANLKDSQRNKEDIYHCWLQVQQQIIQKHRIFSSSLCDWSFTPTICLR